MVRYLRCRTRLTIFFETALVDLVRVGSGGNAAGVRQLANRLLRSLPEDLPDRALFRQRLGEAIVKGSGQSSMRSVSLEQRPVDHLVEWSSPDAEALAPLYVDTPVETLLDQLLAQWTQQERLAQAGLSAANTVLLSGPPGVGKTLLAHHIAAALRLPLATVNLAEIISSLLGGTGKNMRDAMSVARDTESVLLIDEFDAVGKRRDDSTDIGELKRIVNVVLMELDIWPEDRLLIAATNHAHLLDTAVVRRFEMNIDIGLPSDLVRRRFVEALLKDTGCADWVATMMSDATSQQSPAEIERLVRSARRESLTSDVPFDRALLERVLSAPSQDFNRDLAMSQLSARWDLSNREIARIFSVSHPTVASAIRRVAGRNTS